MKKKLSLKTKALLSVALITLVSASTVGGMFLYAKNSDELNGTYSGFTREQLRNDFSQIRDVDNNLKPEIAILDPSKSRTVATINETYDKFTFVFDKENSYDFDEFFQKYFAIFSESFILQVKYGSFSFYNEYVTAVKPKQFIDFTLWFFNNISWGPDLLTLNSFRIVPGVEQNGNAITLGSHSSLHKESSEIKFFPDAFFGSMPIYSSITGNGNARDALSYSLFRDKSSKATLDNFLKTIPYATALKNNASQQFLSLLNPDTLLNKEFLVLLAPNQEKPGPAGEDGKKPATLLNEETLIIPVNSTEASLKEFLQDNFSDQNVINEFLEIFKNSSNANASRKFEKSKIVNVNLTENSLGFTLLINGDEYVHTLEQEKPTTLTPYWYSTYTSFKETLDTNIESFLDFYGYKAYEFNKDKSKRKFWIFKDGNVQKIYQTKTEALDKNKSAIKIKNLSESLANYIFEIELQSLSVSDGVFKAQFDKNISIEFDAKNLTSDMLNAFDEFKRSLGYGGAINPVALQYGPEDISMLDNDGKPLPGLETRKYQVYVETYDGLVERVLRKYPHLRVKRTGPHIVKTLNSNYVYEYSVAEGDFYGIIDSDRIGVPLLLAASLDDFDGLSTDFLKYVGAHEYGHHFTLDQSQSLNDNGKAVVVGGLSTRGGISESSYYSIDALKNYLDARTNLEVTRVNSLGKESDKGTFLKFNFIKNDGTKYIETKSDIWGSDDNDRQDISKIIANPKRRFLQSFAGLQEAAKLRDVKLGDLFIANSFDEESGTLNPYISGILKSFSGTKDNYKFEEVVIGTLLSGLKDGMATNLTEKALRINPDNPNEYTLDPVTFEVTENGRMVRSVNMYDNQGNPVINVPLNTILSSQELKYVDDKVKIIRDTFNALITRLVSDSGWNTTNTIIGGKPQLSIGSLYGQPLSPFLSNNLLYRNDNAELNPLNNNMFSEANPRKAFEYTAVENNLSLIEQLKEFLLASEPDKISDNSGYYYYFISQTNNVYAFVNKDNNEFKINTAYTMPRTQYNDAHVASYFQHTNALAALRNQGINATSRIQRAFHSLFARTFTGIRDARARYIFLFINDQNQLQDPELLDNFNQNAEKINSSFKRIVLNNIRSRLTGKDQKTLYEAYPEGKYSEITDDGQTNKSPSFSSLRDLFEYVSVDYSKARLVDAVTESYNWDINYVKTKIDFDKFKEAATNEAEIQGILNDDQLLANEIMERFIKSGHFIFVKDFNPAKELVNNTALFSKKYGVIFDEPNFVNGFVLDKNVTPNKEGTTNVFDVKDIQNAFSEYIHRIFSDESESKINLIINKLNTQDLWRLVGNTMWFDAHGSESPVDLDLLYSVFSGGTPSSDVLNYNLTRVEPLLSDKFTDYVYNISETLTRDYVQTTYIPNWDDFGGLPKYVTGVNEAKTGLDYVVDATGLDFWLDRRNVQSDLNASVYKAVNAAKYDLYLKNVKNVYYEYQKQSKPYLEKIAEYKDALENNGRMVNGQRVAFASEEDKRNYELEYAAVQGTFGGITAVFTAKILAEKTKIYDEFANNESSAMSRSESRSSSYFGKLLSKNNGYFKDRFQKAQIGMELYDDNGAEIFDESIRLKDFDGNKITSRPKAFFVSQLLNYGVGSRNVAGIFRHKGLDAVAMYGYIKNDLAQKIKFIKFTDLETKEVKYLSVNINKTNNIFYLQKQGDANSKVHIEDLGYTSWVSDYGIMGKYRDALLLPKHSYLLEFVDENQHFVANFNLGDLETIAENGKTSSQAPIKITNEINNNQKTGKAIISIDYQFNITG